MRCPACINELHEECFEIVPGEKDGLFNCCCWGDFTNTSLNPANDVPFEPLAAPEKENLRDIPVDDRGNDNLRDVISTGRKRAAKLKPILDGMVCEWANLKFAGGGVIPILGCNGNTLVREKGNAVNTGNIHHGPDKSVLLNTDQNLHRICGSCHNRWHELNDPFYPSERPANGASFVPENLEIAVHDKHTLATEEERAYHEAWWAMPVSARADLPYRKEA